MELQDHLFSVSELNQVIKNVLESSFYSINIEGELSNFKPASSGHWYFSLKDRNSNISGVMFKNSAYNVNFRPKDGMKVKVKGKLTLYSQRGTYQIVCSDMTLFGEGDILLMLEERKRKFASLGIFDPSKKKLLPKFPKTIAIITSPTGAALQDILKVLKRRHSISDIVILPTMVQGKGAEKTITQQIVKANKDKLCNLIILSRGGGSMEDLLPFSEESVLYAISSSQIPIISGIGHEIDTTLSDLAADVRAATPSAAAEIATVGSEQLYSKLKDLKTSLIQSVKLKIHKIKVQLKVFDKNYVKRYLGSKLDNQVLHIDNLKREMTTNINWKVEKNRVNIQKQYETIKSLSPFKLFEKGYSWVTKEGISINNQRVIGGDKLQIKYKNGTISSIIEED